MSPETLLFVLLRSAVCEKEIAPDVMEACTTEMLNQVYILAQKHDIAHLPGHVLGKLQLPESEPRKKMIKAAHMAVFRYARIDREIERICTVLEEERIPFLPLKGAVVRECYPEPWMRTSCDIDILVHEEDLERATDALVSRLTYATDHYKQYHDVSLFSNSGVHLELHFSIQENMENIDRLLCKVWDYAIPVTDYRYQLERSFLVFHLLAHMSYHFMGGGCGIRPFLDLFLLQKQHFYDEKMLRRHLSQCGIEKFYDGVLALIGAWFRGQEHTELTRRIENYLFNGGTYGSQQQRIAVQQERKGGKMGYLLERIFMPYDHLKIKYRVLEKHPILYPVMQMRRWGELLKPGKLSRSIRELEINQQTQKKQAEETNEILLDLGL